MLIFLDENPYHISNRTIGFRQDKEEPNPPDLIFTPAPKNGGRYPVRVLLIGIPDGVTSVIHELYLKQFAETAAWSPAFKARYPGEIMKVMTRYVVT
jgi:hypothetical protein